MIYLVVMHPRSGSTMMMQALEAGGLPVVRSDSRDAFNLAHSDAAYRPNPKGLYEPDFKTLQKPGIEKEWDGCAVKIPVGFVHLLPVHDYRVCFMRRDPEEIRQSFEAAFSAPRTLEDIESSVSRGLGILRNRKDVTQLTEVRYQDMIENAAAELEKLGWPIDIQAAAAVVDPALYRFRRENLTDGA